MLRLCSVFRIILAKPCSICSSNSLTKGFRILMPVVENFPWKLCSCLKLLRVQQRWPLLNRKLLHFHFSPRTVWAAATEMSMLLATVLQLTISPFQQRHKRGLFPLKNPCQWCATEGSIIIPSENKLPTYKLISFACCLHKFFQSIKNFTFLPPTFHHKLDVGPSILVEFMLLW